MASKIIVALDGLSATHAWKLAQQVGSEVAGFKGNSLEDEVTIQVIMQALKETAPNCFYFSDPKIKDIPDTVRRRVDVRAELGVRLVTVHMDGGEAMVRSAVRTAEGTDTLVTGVSILTSIGERDVEALGYPLCVSSPWSLESIVETMYKNAYEWGVGAFVCSGLELPILKTVDESRILSHARIKKIVPGVRMPGGNANDQRRVVTPRKAVEDGADYVVIGREIVKADDPLSAAKRINDHIGG